MTNPPFDNSPGAAGGRPLYPIRAVARLTGLGIDTLRAWERRHHAVTPLRDDRGRLYTDADVQRLRLLREVVMLGHSIGRIAHLPDDELRRLTETPARRTLGGAARPATPPAVDIQGLMVAVETFDTLTLESELGRAALLLKPSELLATVLLPLLQRVGDDWHTGRGTVAQEHFVSTCVRSVLGTVLRSHVPRDTAKRLLFATPSGELHELGTLGAALLAAAHGVGVVYLGADLPPGDIIGSATAAAVDGVVLGLTGVSPNNGLSETVADVAAKLPPAMELWIGGPAAERVAGRLGARAICVSTHQEFLTQVERMVRGGSR
ncbi:MAG: MerR family transcriptional regulator [Vicinamibacterales bacterium]